VWKLTAFRSGGGGGTNAIRRRTGKKYSYGRRNVLCKKTRVAGETHHVRRSFPIFRRFVFLAPRSKYAAKIRPGGVRSPSVRYGILLARGYLLLPEQVLRRPSVGRIKTDESSIIYDFITPIPDPPAEVRNNDSPFVLNTLPTVRSLKTVSNILPRTRRTSPRLVVGGREKQRAVYIINERRPFVPSERKMCSSIIRGALQYLRGVSRGRDSRARN